MSASRTTTKKEGAVAAAAEVPALSSSAIAEAVEQLTGTRAHMTNELHLLAGGAFAGPAVTIRLVRDDKASVTEAGLAAIKLLESSPAGSVVVAVLEDDKGFAVFGSTFAALAQTRQLAGFIVDGAVRDVTDLRRLGFPTVARGTVQGSAGGHYRVEGVNVPVRCGGIEVRPGDRVVVDEDGVAVAPGERYDEVVPLATKFQIDKQALVALIQKHRSYLKAMQERDAARRADVNGGGHRLIGAAAATAIAGAVFFAATAALPDGRIDGWPFYGHDAGGMRYSPLAAITRANVARLTVAWTFHTGDVADSRNSSRRSGFEATPLVVDDTLYVTTPFNRVVALDPETGARRWTFDPKIDRETEYGDGLINRGLATWIDLARGSPDACRRRLFEATLDARLVAIDAATGQPCADFGENGQVALRGVSGYEGGIYHMTSPPAVADGLVIVGSSINDNARARMPAGVVRAFDARTGVQRWAWDPVVPAPDAATGAANAWSVMAVDVERHLVFVPTGSASPDYYGGHRRGDNKWANSIVALDTRTGRVAWGFQLVHHDLWDYDTASPPLLTTLVRAGRRIPVVVASNKTGLVYVLDRETGRPVFDVEERRVPPSDIPGEEASRTQPFPSAPPPLTPHRFTADDVWGSTPADRDACLAQVAALRNDGIFTPPSLQGSIEVPGILGGANWSGSAFDPRRGLLVVNSNVLPSMVKLVPRAAFDDPNRRSDDGEYAPQQGTPYGMFRRFLQAPSGLPCIRPPWGVLSAVDLATGRLRWQVPLGSMHGFGGVKADVPPGSFSLGGPIATAGGIVFIAGTYDPFLRAFDIETGRELWKGELPASGHATPITYQIRSTGRQYVVVSAGGHSKISEERLSDALVAFALQ